MQNFFYDDEFYSELIDLLDQMDLNVENIQDLPDDHAYQCYESICQPLVTLSSDWINERIDDERWPEDPDSISERLTRVLDSNIDFAKVNALIPQMYYPTKVKFIITKEDILNYIS